ncbi:restriction endonuclease subunit S [Coraliomargarita sp. SDUM461003]|uniref:Restriction endonuclease subunit S n=1 Tax=Thalassobacterium maritimum TaxID=3041265 RepID=A0ABU1ATB1_9BACT|nr:restriction endonuclease subunit S [Coraliomargarita sp. SDUM461003]MDQ8207383.1 restriction endonuclease subunit S [Coraliomargarita sp. SDUM461003]
MKTRKWRKHKLSEVADLCLGKMLDKKKNKGELHPYLGNIHVRWGRFNLEDLPEMRFEKHEHDRYGLKSGDLVVCEGGEPGRCALWKGQVPGMKIQKALHRVRPHKSLDGNYLLYWFLHAGQRNYFDQYSTGATIKHLPGEKLAKIEIDVPDLPTQKKIAGILSAYDDLIENNLRRIAILEEMAQSLYREWFVHFRIPSEVLAQAGLPAELKLVDSELGKIPAGWEVKKLIDVTSKIGSGATPKGGKDAYKSEGISLIRSLNIFDYQFKHENLARIDEKQAAKLSNVIVEVNDVLLNITGASVARCSMVPPAVLPARVNQHVAIIRASPESDPFYILDTINSEERKRQILSLAQGGATREALTKTTIENLEIVMPSETVLQAFSKIRKNLFDQCQILDQKNQNLRKTRDLLLSKLLS